MICSLAVVYVTSVEFTVKVNTVVYLSAVDNCYCVITKILVFCFCSVIEIFNFYRNQFGGNSELHKMRK